MRQAPRRAPWETNNQVCGPVNLQSVPGSSRYVHLAKKLTTTHNDSQQVIPYRNLRTPWPGVYSTKRQHPRWEGRHSACICRRYCELFLLFGSREPGDNNRRPTLRPSKPGGFHDMSDPVSEEVLTVPYNLRSRSGRPTAQTPQKAASFSKTQAHQLTYASSPEAHLKGSSESGSPSASDQIELQNAASCEASASPPGKTLDQLLSGSQPAHGRLSQDADTRPSLRQEAQGACMQHGSSSGRARDQTSAEGAPAEVNLETSQSSHERSQGGLESTFASPVHGLLHHGQAVQPLVPYLSPASPALSQEEVMSCPQVTIRKFLIAGL